MQADEGMVSFARTNAHFGLIVTSGVNNASNVEHCRNRRLLQSSLKEKIHAIDELKILDRDRVIF